MTQLFLQLGAAVQVETKRINRDQVRCPACQAVWQRPYYSLKERHRNQVLCCPCGVETTIPGDEEKD